MSFTTCSAAAFLSPPTTSVSLSQPKLEPFLSKRRKAAISQRPSLRIRINPSKRSLNLSILSLLLNGFLPELARSTEDAASEELQRYTDFQEGFTLLIPSSWIKVEKAGATVLFEQPEKGSNNVGVVVNPVRIKSLGEFGSPQFVADKLILAEKRKESTKDAEVISAAERLGQGGLQVYEFEYKVDSTRGGMKRIFSAAFVNSMKLYLLNVAHSDKPESPLDSRTRMILEATWARAKLEAALTGHKNKVLLPIKTKRKLERAKRLDDKKVMETELYLLD